MSLVVMELADLFAKTTILQPIATTIIMFLKAIDLFLVINVLVDLIIIL